MNKIKRVISMLIVCCMVLGMTGVLPVMAETEGAAGIMTVADFGTAEAAEKYAAKDTGILSASVAETYDNAQTSVKWTLPAGRYGTPGIPFEKTDVSDYTHFRMRFYSANAGEQFAVYASSDYEKGVGVPYFFRVITTTGNGWQEISVPLTFFTAAKKTIDEVETAPSWDNINGIVLYTDFLSAQGVTHTTGANIYIDEIWFENSSNVYSTNTTDIAEGDVTVLDVKSVADQDATGGSQHDYIETVNAREGGNGAYLMQYVAPLTEAYELKTIQIKSAADITAKKYLNIWMYSPKATNSAFIIRTLDSAGGYKGYYKENAGSEARMMLDWKGWKLISIDLSYTWGGGSSGTFDPSKFNRVQFIMNYSKSSQTGSATPQWHTEGYYGVEKIWFSETKATAVAEIPAAGTSWEFPDKNEMIYEFNSNDTIINSSNTGQNSHATANVWNSNLYGANYRNAFGTMNDGFVALVCAFNNNAELVEKTKNNNYVNFWMYNPGIKYNGTDVSDVCILLESKWGSTTQHHTVTLDWEGWKMVSIPLNDAVKENGFGLIRLAGNTLKNGTVTKGCTYSDCSATPSVELKLARYFDIDNIWVSNSLISETEITNIEVVDNAYMFTFNNELSAAAADKISVYNNYEKVEAATVMLSGKTASVVLPSVPGEDDYYQIKFDKEMRDAYGAKLFDESYVYEDINSDVLTIDNEEMTISGFEDMTFAQIRAALNFADNLTLVFDDGNGEISDETITAESGASVIFMLGDGTDYSVEYTLDVPMSTLSNIAYTVNGESTTTFAKGTFTASLDGICYKKTAKKPLWLAVAQYKGDELVQVKFDDVTLANGKSETLSVSMDITETTGTEMKVFLWDGLSNMNPINDAAELLPAAE